MLALDHQETTSEVASKVQYMGAGIGVVGGIQSTDMIAVVGVLIGIAGFLVNWYYKHQEFLLKEKELEGRYHGKNPPNPDDGVVPPKPKDE